MPKKSATPTKAIQPGIGGVAFGAPLAGGAVAGPIGAFTTLPVAALISSVVSNYGASHEVVYESEHTQDVAVPPRGQGQEDSE